MAEKEDGGLIDSQQTRSTRGRWNKLTHISLDALPEHPAFKRNKLTLLSMGIAVVLVANVTFLGFLTPPRPPATPLLYFDQPTNSELDGDPSNGFANFIISKLAKDINGSSNANATDNGFGDLSVADYVSLFATVDTTDFCNYKLSTAFLVFNGFAFSFALATLFLVAVVPVFIRRQHWDAYLARVGAICISITLLFLVTAFILAGFVTGGVCLQSCDYTEDLGHVVSSGKLPSSQATAVSASGYATLGVTILLLAVVCFMAVKESRSPEKSSNTSSDASPPVLATAV